MIVQKTWPWTGPLTERTSTDYIVVHHTAGPQEQDTQEIWDEHVKIGDIGIAYHLIIKGDGTIVQGRPDNTVGAHAIGVNHNSVGVCLEGNFQEVDIPTSAQMTSLSWCLDYYRGLYPGAKTIGHRQVAGLVNRPDYATACPGDTLHNMLKGMAA